MPIMEGYWGNKNKMYTDKRQNTAILSITEHFTTSYINICFIFSNSDIQFFSENMAWKNCCPFLQHYSEKMRVSGKEVKTDYKNKQQV